MRVLIISGVLSCANVYFGWLNSVVYLVISFVGVRSGAGVCLGVIWYVTKEGRQRFVLTMCKN